MAMKMFQTPPRERRGPGQHSSEGYRFSPNHLISGTQPGHTKFPAGYLLRPRAKKKG